MVIDVGTDGGFGMAARFLYGGYHFSFSFL